MVPFLGLVIEDLLNLFHDLRGQLFKQFERTAVVPDLLGFRRTQDNCTGVWVLRNPSKRQLGHGTSEPLGNLGHLFDLLNLRLACLALKSCYRVLKELRVGCKSRILGNTIVVFACKEA